MRVVAVEYLNTLPMIYGIRCAAHTVSCDDLSRALTLAPPSRCAELAKEGKCDIALVPVGALSEIPGAQIITSFCISATKEVDTVALLSNTQLSQITTIYRDSHSRTSVKLCEILCRELWKITPKFIDGLPSNGKLNEGEALVAIGDKVFDIENNYAIKTDLSEQWWTLTSLPFVFAVWIALTPEGLSAQDALNSALNYGITHIQDALPDDPLRPRNLRYLTESIEFSLSEAKLKSMGLFLSKI